MILSIPNWYKVPERARNTIVMVPVGKLSEKDFEGNLRRLVEYDMASGNEPML